MNRLGIAIAITLAFVLTAAPAGAQAKLGGAPGSCDEACLRSMADAYFAAPFDFESVHIFEIQKGQIHDIEAMGISLPFRSKNGWSEFWR